MRSQSLAIKLAAGVTGLFLLSVGLVLAWPWLSATVEQGPAAVRNFNQQVFVMPEMQGHREEPIAPRELANVRGAVTPANEFALSAPQTHGNLTVFLIHGKDTVKDANILTLQEALEQGLATVHDRGNLFIDNRGDAPLFIQSGDIVKGGNQDRTLPFDTLIPARTNMQPVAAMCVEAGRSRKRGEENNASFETSTQQLPTLDLRLAASRRDQNAVWNNVRTVQDKLARNAGGSVQAPLSHTSLQLSLEHQRVQNAVQEYVANLAPAAGGKNDVVGYVTVVNGQIQSAEVYGSSSLFRKLWPKLIRASAVAALADKVPGKFEAPAPEAVRAFLADADGGQASRVHNGAGSHVIREETGRQVRFDTCDASRQNVVLHRSWLAK